MFRAVICPAAIQVLALLAALGAAAAWAGNCPDLDVPVGSPLHRDPRPAELVAGLEVGPLRERLEACLAADPMPATRTIGHRGAPLYYPEHTRESYLAAARLGASTLECDVTFTAEGDLVCRHDACDLHRTTNILETPLASTCAEPFRPALLEEGVVIRPASARCCAAQLTTSEFLSLEGRHDRVNPAAENVAQYLSTDPSLPSCLDRGKLLTHRDSIALFKDLGMAMAPELKGPGVSMPFRGKSEADFADQLVQDYREAGVAPERVWLQSFDPNIIQHWLATGAEFGGRVVWLDGRYALDDFDHRDEEALGAGFRSMKQQGLQFVAPPLWMLVEAGVDGIVTSRYAVLAQEAGLSLLSWTLERSGPLETGGGWYYQTLNGANPLPASRSGFRIRRDADQLMLAQVLFEEIGVHAVFSDWPSTTALTDTCLAAPLAGTQADTKP
ncbi:MAG: glycerophosphodiester phosphodiesterase family protein [Pseudomonadota bacterium]